MGTTANPNAALDHHLATVLERIGEVSRALRLREAVEAEISPLQLRILGFIADHSDTPVGVARLADELQISRPTISVSVRLLVEQGLLLRRADPADRRGHTLRLSAKALRGMTAGSPFDDAVATLAPSSKEALLLALMQVLHQLVGSRKLQVQRMCWTCAHYDGDRKEHHRCLLLKKTLKVRELRTDCAEHDAA
jgi:DNA-binding MarR family transcriptional regulator